jgi:transposase InsO family protein
VRFRGFRRPWHAAEQQPAECLDWLLIRSERHLDRVLREFVTHYNHERPHRGIDLGPPVP